MGVPFLVRGPLIYCIVKMQRKSGAVYVNQESKM